MSAREQAVIAQCWELGRFIPDDADPTPPPPTPLHLTNRGVATALSVGNLVSRVAAFSDLYEEHLVDSKPIVRPHTSEHPTADAFEEEEEEVRRIALGLEQYPEAEGSTSSPDSELTSKAEAAHAGAKSAIVHAAELLADEKGAALLDARLKCLPAAEYTESPKQRHLTDCEAEVYELAFGDSPEPSVENGARVTAAMKVVRDIETRMPAVRGIYTRALAIPREEHHAACRELLTRMGVPIVFARVPYEAEGLCAAMALSGVVDFAGTEDSDVVAYGVSCRDDFQCFTDAPGPASAQPLNRHDATHAR